MMKEMFTMALESHIKATEVFRKAWWKNLPKYVYNDIHFSHIYMDFPKIYIFYMHKV